MTYRAAEDADLVARFVDGDVAAFDELMAAHEDRVFGICLRMLRDRDMALDAVQETFINVFRKADRYKAEAAFSTWLYRLAANHVVDRGRRARRERGRVEMPEQVVDTSPGADAGVESAERVAVLRAAIQELDTRYREALFLVYVEGLKVDEAARMLEIPEGTVKTRLMRGRQALKKILARRHPEHFGD